METSHAGTDQDVEPIDQCEAEESLACSHIANIRSVDWEQLQSEDKLGCARGIAWAIIFEIALAIAGALFWKLRHFPR
jgi:hypothetical protein